ncbi:LOW QUALITY PROTEIN: hypothetical protein HID58_046423 [Brassica napus]|uniref:Cytochrome b5 heme-binding domain-containing protein n=3 Tax=Brassica TaxID=3705 RepID=A0ABQ8AWD3_BRANA|nr:LOW QUALITY PROTEIN: hypothetical protein HID58_046423 [Brassica napus]
MQIKQEETLFSIYRRKNMRSSLMVEKDARIEVEREERDDLEETQNEPDDFNSIPPWKSQITFRGIVASLIIGIIYNLIVMKLNLTTGLIPTLNVSAALSAFVLLRSWTKLLTKAGIMTKPFTKQENTVVQTCAVACYSVTIGGGFGSYLLSLNTRTYEQSGVHTEGNSPGSTKEPGIGWMTCFLFFTCFVGLLALVPLRKICRNDKQSITNLKRDEIFVRDSIPIWVAALQTRNCFNLHKTQLKWYFIVVAYMIAPSLGFSNAYGAGLTDMNMAYNYGKVALFILAAMSGKQNGVVAGLVGCGLIKSIVSISSDLMHDFKTGHLTLTSPRSMLVSQAIGTGIGCIVAPLSFFLFYKAFDVGNPEGEYKAPYALVYRNMAILGVEGFSALPLHCLQLCYGFFAFAVAADVVRDLSPEKVGKWVPLPMAMAVPFLVGGYFAVDMCVGSLIVFVWNMRDRVKAGLMVPAVASGLICGDGLWILPSSILALAGVKPPICMRFVPKRQRKYDDVVAPSLLHVYTSRFHYIPQITTMTSKGMTAPPVMVSMIFFGLVQLWTVATWISGDSRIMAVQYVAGRDGTRRLRLLMASDKKVLGFEEVSQHNKTKDCWLIISGKVYDVTPFMDDHPGGDEVLLSSTGKDATNDFEDVGHSDTARDMMEKYYIGEIDSSSVPKTRTYVAPAQPAYNQDKTPEFIIKILQFLVPILILGLALVVRQYTKKE